MLLINKFKYEKLTRDESTGKRLYATPTGDRVPSVTTILDKTKSEESKIALANWRKAVGEERARQITTEAASRGTRMHKFLEDYVKGISTTDKITNPYSIQSQKMAQIIIDLGMNRVNEVWGSEVPVYFPKLYAGTTDCCGIHDGNEAILDFKQTNKPKRKENIDDYFTQLVFYGTAHNEVHGTNIQKGVILMCSKDYEFQEFIIEGAEWKKYEHQMWTRLEQYYSELL